MAWVMVMWMTSWQTAPSTLPQRFLSEEACVQSARQLYDKSERRINAVCISVSAIAQ